MAVSGALPVSDAFAAGGAVPDAGAVEGEDEAAGVGEDGVDEDGAVGEGLVADPAPVEDAGEGCDEVDGEVEDAGAAGFVSSLSASLPARRWSTG